MGRRGPPPLPSALKKLRGNPGRRPLNPREPQPPPAIGPCPRRLTGMARKIWKEFQPKLATLGLFRSIDPKQFELYCFLLAEYWALETRIKKDGRIIESKDKDGVTKIMRHPGTLEAARLRADVMRLAREFGMTPASRPGIDAGETGMNDDRDDFDAFLRAKNG